MDSPKYIGMDVHKESLDLRVRKPSMLRSVKTHPAYSSGLRS